VKTSIRLTRGVASNEISKMPDCAAGRSKLWKPRVDSSVSRIGWAAAGAEKARARKTI
jgi:hypothetical protein